MGMWETSWNNVENRRLKVTKRCVVSPHAKRSEMRFLNLQFLQARMSGVITKRWLFIVFSEHRAHCLHLKYTILLYNVLMVFSLASTQNKMCKSGCDWCAFACVCMPVSVATSASVCTEVVCVCSLLVFTGGGRGRNAVWVRTQFELQSTKYWMRFGLRLRYLQRI